MVVICNKPYTIDAELTYGEHFENFAYTLADFQKYSIEAIVRGFHVLVCAPTGSGKTTPAEFAVEHFVSRGKKVVYTTPIKALSNQKYYDLTQRFPQYTVGLMTGDIKINPAAQIIVCTAEILLNTLVSGCIGGGDVGGGGGHLVLNVAEELACVVMDEVHFINDQHRGKTWENTIMTLPPHVQLVMLSATIDAPEKFAAWCETTTAREVWVSSLTRRAVPLVHYAYLTTTESIYKKIKDKATQTQLREMMGTFHVLKDDNTNFNLQTYNTINRGKILLRNNQVFVKQQHVINSVLWELKQRDLFPAIMFVFSKKRIERIAKEITTNLLEDDSKIPYIMRRECDQIVRSKLSNSDEYLSLPEYSALVALLEKGIGIHHASMMPLLREIVEIMILQKKIKVLISTETFFIGLNCPIRTAIFTSMTKFDGDVERHLYSAEYQQGSGRCGRKGIDAVGHVIHLSNLFGLPSVIDYKGIMCGKPQTLSSKFRIGYGLVLRIAREMGGGDAGGNSCVARVVEYVKRSMMYSETQKEIERIKTMLVSLETDLQKKESVLELMQTPRDICVEYAGLTNELKTANNKKRRDVERRLAEIEDSHRHIRDDTTRYTNCESFRQTVAKTRGELDYLQTFVEKDVAKIYDMLVRGGFISGGGGGGCWDDGGDGGAVTARGTIALGVAEIHPLVFADVLYFANFFVEWSVAEVVGYLSCFCGLRGGGGADIDEETKEEPVDNIIVEGGGKDDIVRKNERAKATVSRTRERLDYYFTAECELGICSGELYDDIDDKMVDLFAEWCECGDETACKYFIYSCLGSAGVALGDFTKAILKISAICKEAAAATSIGGDRVDFQHKMSLVDGAILKYVATAQSLYL